MARPVDPQRGRLIGLLSCECGRTWSLYDGDGHFARHLADWHRHDARGGRTAGFCCLERSAQQLTTVALF